MRIETPRILSVKNPLLCLLCVGKVSSMFTEDCQLAGTVLQRRGGRAGARSEEAAVHEDLHDRRGKGPAKEGDHDMLSERKTQRRKWDEK